MATLIHIGPRLGRFDKHGKPIKMRGHSTVLANLGTMILVIGWIGFNSGPTSPGSDLFSIVILNTIVSLCFGGAAGLVFGMWQTKGKIHPRYSTNGILGGLVAITACCAYVDYQQAAFIGVLGGLSSAVAADVLLQKFKLDDPVDAIAVHGVAGVVGCLLVALFAKEQFLAGSRFEQLQIQTFGVFLAVIWSFCATFAILKAISLVWTFRVNKEDEKIGLNISEHDDEFDITTARNILSNSEYSVSESTLEVGGEEITDSSKDVDVEMNAFSEVVRNADIAERRYLRARDEANFLATRDRITGFYNRHAFVKEVNNRRMDPQKSLDPFSIITIELLGIKSVTEVFEQQASDDIIKIIAQRMLELVSKDAIISRSSDDMFQIFLRQKPSEPQSWKILCDDLIELISEGIDFRDHQFHFRASIGVARFPYHANDTDELIRKSTLALSQSKVEGFGFWLEFSGEMEESRQRYKQLESQMREGVNSDEFVAHYQAQVCAGTGQLEGFESLVRWEHPKYGLVSPAEFIPISEETGLIVEIGRSIMLQSCRAAASWPSVNGEDLEISVNVSPIQFSKCNVVSMIEDCLNETGLSPHRLKIEITESSVMENQKQMVEILKEVRKLGVKIALDDFGTGYSSISYLQEFPLDTLKVDQSFVRGLQGNSTKEQIIEAVIKLGKTLDLNVIAEGVETEDERDILLNLGCDQLQGYLYSKPLPLASTLEYIVKANEKPIFCANADIEEAIQSTA